MCGYSVPSVPPHLGSSEARRSSDSAIGLQGPGIINFLGAGVCTTPSNIFAKAYNLYREKNLGKCNLDCLLDDFWLVAGTSRGIS